MNVLIVAMIAMPTQHVSTLKVVIVVIATEHIPEMVQIVQVSSNYISKIQQVVITLQAMHHHLYISAGRFSLWSQWPNQNQNHYAAP